MKKCRSMLCIILIMCMLASGLPISASASGTLPFTDVADSAWYRDSVEYVYENGIMSGTAADKFSPNLTTTRGMIVTVLHRLEGEPKAEGQSFTDVKSGKYYAEAVTWASSLGIVTGYGNGKFGPNDPITREQLAAILFRYSNTVGSAASERGELGSFSDSGRVSPYAREALSWAVGTQLISGVGNNMLDPSGSATRAQVAAILTRMLSNAPSGKFISADEPSGGYGIFDITVAPGSFHAKISTVEECRLSVEVLDEDENLLHKDIYTLSEGLQLGDVKLLTDFEFPEHFIIKATIIDRAGSPLCDTFFCLKYTEAYSIFAEKTEADFGTDKLIDLADENDGNFALMQDDVFMLSSSPILEDSASLVFSSAEFEELGIEAGDKICFTDTDGRYAAIIISDIDFRDGFADVSVETDSCISDFYKIIKIDTDLHIEKDTVPGSSSGSSDGSSDGSQWLSEIEMSSGLSNSFATPFGSFGYSTAVGAKMEIRYDVELFGPDYIEVTMLLANETTLNLEIGPNKKVSDSIEIISIPLAGLKDIADIPLEISLKYEIDCDAGLDTTVKMESVSGLVYNSLYGCQKVEYKDISVGEVNLEGEIEAQFGLELSVKASLFDDLLSVGLGATGGVGWTARAESPSAPLPGSDSYHACGLCADGSCYGFFEVDFSAEAEISKNFSGDIFDVDFLSLKWTICRFYLSFINEAESVHEGNFKFDFGECPNKKYRAKLSTYYNNKEKQGITVSLEKDSGWTNCGSSLWECYLYPGQYTASASIEELESSEAFTVQDSPVNIRLDVYKYSLSGRVSDTESGEALSGASVKVVPESGDPITVSTDSSGVYTLTLPGGKYDLLFSAEKHKSYSTWVSLTSDKTINARLKKIPYPGILEGIITDEESGEPISGASVSATAADGTVISAVSDSSGHYTMELPADTSYELSFSAKDHKPATARLTVKDKGEYVIDKALKPLTGEVTIEVVSRGRPYSGATVEVSGPGGFRESYVTGSDGRVTIKFPEDAAEGSYGITARTNEYYGNASFTLPEDDFVRVDAFMLIHIRPR